MKIFLRDHKNHLAQYIPLYKKRNSSVKAGSKLIENSSSVNIRTGKKLSELDTGFLLDYKIFPSNILTYAAEWMEEKREIQPADIIVQQAYLPPIKSFSQKVVFAVRIKEVFRSSKRIGFSYETLEGHAECGISTFSLEESENGQIIFKIHTLSAPGNLLTRLLGPVFTLPYQRYCTRLALANVKKQLEE